MTENKNVLFVCTGNLCRSPMAEHLFRRSVGENSPWTAESAGLSAVDGLAASQTAIAVMDEAGLDLRPHRSRELTKEIIDAATIILVMTNAQAMEVKRRFPRARDRVHLLGSFNPAARGTAAGEKEISDPIGAGLEVYRRTRNNIDKSIGGLIEYLKSFQEK